MGRSLISAPDEAEVACQVVPEIPSFSVDDGFTYSVPRGMSVSVGSRVRVRVSGRRLTGYVTAVLPRPTNRRLLPVDKVSGNASVFDEGLLAVCRWAAVHYVAPLATVLARTSPPNVPRRSSQPERGPTPGPTGRLPYRVSRAPHVEAVEASLGELGEGRSRIVIVPSSEEAIVLAEQLRGKFPNGVEVATSAMSDATVTRAWGAAAHDPDTILVGTREVALWRAAGGGAWVIVEDGRRVMKSPSTPTMHARDLVMARRRHVRTPVAMIGPVPTLEALAYGVEIVADPGRSWGPVEVFDRTREPPSPHFVTEHARRAILAVLRSGRRVFVLVGVRGYAPAFRCVACGSLRRCSACGTAAADKGACRRCGNELGRCAGCRGIRFAPLGAGIGAIVDEIAGFAGHAAVGTAEDPAAILVGTERDLIGLASVGLGLVVDADGMVGAPHFRAAEDTLRLIARLANRVGGRHDARTIVQTSDPDHLVLSSLREGRFSAFVRAEQAARRAARFPPYGELIAIEVANSPEADQRIRAACEPTATVRGPAHMRDRERWLVHGNDLAEARLALRGAVDALRASGARVRIDADPIDL
ncbi:MAG: hypothetical protein R2823_07545 [Acidimicrobiia bacterium]